MCLECIVYLQSFQPTWPSSYTWDFHLEPEKNIPPGAAFLPSGKIQVQGMRGRKLLFSEEVPSPIISEKCRLDMCRVSLKLVHRLFCDKASEQHWDFCKGWCMKDFKIHILHGVGNHKSKMTSFAAMGSQNCRDAGRGRMNTWHQVRISCKISVFPGGRVSWRDG